MTQSLPEQHHTHAQTSAGRAATPVVVVGAGPYGLSVAAHLRAVGVPVRVFGDVMGSWRHAMATGMFLKSTPAATDLSAPGPGGRLADFRRLHGEPELTELTPIPCEVFVRYGQWFQKRYVGDVDPARVVAVDKAATGFGVRLDDGRELAAAAVVVATGLNGLAHVPDELRRLAPEGPGIGALVSHTSHHTDLSRYAGQRVAVVGGGQSALESAALLHEAGAEVQVLVREQRVLWGMTPDLGRPWTQRVAKPASPLGTGWVLAAVCKAPGGVRLLPSQARLLLFRRALGPSGGWWLRDRVEGVVPVRTSCRVTRATAAGSAAHLELAEPDGRAVTLAVDHVLAATGYRLDLDVIPFLSPAVRGAVACVPGSKAPALTGTFESSVPGLYFTGSLAAPMFGPMMRFVAGTEFAATRIARHAARLTTTR
ncbi:MULTISPECIES: FAD-dependent oxidoreductase [unclassified Streptomyces]|uniref:FAD-dependent oxidoreductase n=1 Tax=unclassified Streptomyces TaxID=2593676 RepID=UPI0011ACCC9A|nr:FAD-dependent oxidoreductase [Streptomyces sp. BK340]TVZ83263.1 cation diffusion facilitator CzcD-associated flavoprotein CzcO [Streptomyces sp. BK340]